jgi:hypothetical protein
MTRIRPGVAVAVALVLLLAACSAGGASTPAPSPSASASPTMRPPASATPSEAPSDGHEIGCDLGGHDAAYHIHTLVGIRIDGDLYAPPANIGITDCMYWVHTHAADGIVHVEAPAQVAPTLGAFLDIWAETYPDDDLLARAHAAIAAGEVTLDDQPYAGDALAVPLKDKLRIILGG